MLPYEIVTIESFRGPFPIVIVINSIIKIEMGILFFQIGFIDESKHALALSSKKIRRRKKFKAMKLLHFFLFNENKI